jgi:hypothetical protein
MGGSDYVALLTKWKMVVKQRKSYGETRVNRRREPGEG